MRCVHLLLHILAKNSVRCTTVLAIQFPFSIDMRPPAVIGLCILYLHVARRRWMCLQLIASLPDRRDIRCLLYIALPAIARCATQSKLVFFCCLVGTCVSVGNVFMSGASRDDVLCAAQTSTNGHGLRSMDTGEEDPVQLENFRPETCVAQTLSMNIARQDHRIFAVSQR